MIRKLFLLVLTTLAVTYCTYFPGHQRCIAFSLATGLGIPSIQARVDALEEKAIRGNTFSDDDRRFLIDLYTCFAKGGRLTYVLREPAAMMEHYLAGTGEPLRVEPRIFLLSRPVQERMSALQQRIERDLAAGQLLPRYETGTFYMNDPRHIETFVALHFGELSVRPEVSAQGTSTLRWRAELPWQWPSYDWIYQRFGRHHAMSFPIPNARSILQGSRHSLYIDDGLGEYLAQLGLARPFLVHAEWETEGAAAAQPEDVDPR